jgi:phosphatidate phosphatase APP1
VTVDGEYSEQLYGPGEETVVPRRRRAARLHRLRLRRPRLRIDAYHGHGTAERFYLKGRVLRDPGIRDVAAARGVIHNLKNTLRRALTNEVPHARVAARFGAASVDARADDEGFFRIVLPLHGQPLAPGTWHDVELELLESSAPEPVRATARVLVPPASAEFGVISDIDDTVVRTEATNWLRMLRIVLLTNAHSRMPFAHVDALYRALQEGSDGHRQNPIFYLSSGPWNFYDLLEEFMRVHGIPEGPLFLRNWNASPRGLLGMKHGDHKLVRLRHLLEVYPALPWVLIGDSGQEDPEIYRDVARACPGRVKVIYIRSVIAGSRADEVRAIRTELADHGVEMLLIDEKTEAAEHAAERGLITRAALDAMRLQDRTPEPEPDLIEKVVNPDAR